MRISDWSSDVCSSDLAADADAVAEAGDRDLVTFVEQRGNGRACRVDDRHRDRIAFDRIDGQPNAERSEQARRPASQRDDIAIAGDRSIVGFDADNGLAGPDEAFDAASEQKFDPARGGQVGERGGEFETVAGRSEEHTSEL